MNVAQALSCVFVTIFFSAYSQLIFKWQVLRKGSLPGDMHQRIHFYLTLFLNPWVMSAILAIFLGGVAWTAAMTKLPLSIACPIMSLTFPIIIILSTVLFSEPLRWQQIASIALIMGAMTLMRA